MPVIVFDFFGVISCEVAPFVLPKYMSAEKAAQIKRTLVHQADLGAISQDEFYATLGKIVGVSGPQLLAEFKDQISVDPAVVALVEDLRKTHRVSLLTNALVPYVRDIFAQYDLARLFEVILVSSEEHLAKPDPAFFQLMLDKMGVAAADAIMIDDNPDNIAAATGIGMKGVLYRTLERLKAELAGLI
jgi:putative hydrolase of the HAD superfamily